MNEDQLKKNFERVFRQSLADGRENVRHLIERAMRLGGNAERAGLGFGGKTTINDADFLRLVFFAIIGAGFEQEYPLGQPPEIEAAKQKLIGDITEEKAAGPIVDVTTLRSPMSLRRPERWIDPEACVHYFPGAADHCHKCGTPLAHVLRDRDLKRDSVRGVAADAIYIDEVKDFDVAMSNDPRRPEQLYRCGTCCKDMEASGAGWACVNQDCPDFHQAVEIEL